MKKLTKPKSANSRNENYKEIESPDTSKDTARKSTGSVQVASGVLEFDSEKMSGEKEIGLKEMK